MLFKNRASAAYMLLDKLMAYRGQNPLILAIPRGAIEMAAILALGLEGELGLILVHKIPAPSNEEYAIASIGLSGTIVYQDDFPYLSLPKSYLEQESQRQLSILKERFKNYGLNEEYYQTIYSNRIVIIVDDGIATGATVLSAIREVKTQNPSKIIIAAPVASYEAAEKLKSEVDELCILEVSKTFYSVSQFYQNFSQVSDEQVIQILNSQKLP